MPFFASPSSFRLLDDSSRLSSSAASFSGLRQLIVSAPMDAVPLASRASHPALGNLILLVFEAVLEVVCVSLPGYIVARQGMFDVESQKFVANLNVALFTPCLIFTKLASQLTASKLVDLAVIPVIFLVQTLVSYVCSAGVSWAFGLKQRPRNFVVAMGVFGNSNSLPISLVISLSKTISGLHWDRIPGDDDDEVGARGILYLLLFQQLGQLLRWSWGYHVLLAPPEKYEGEVDHSNSRIERGHGTFSDDAGANEDDDLLVGLDEERDHPTEQASWSRSGTQSPLVRLGDGPGSPTGSEYESGGQTPVTQDPYTSSVSSSARSTKGSKDGKAASHIVPTPTNGNALLPDEDYHRIATTPPAVPTSTPDAETGPRQGFGGRIMRLPSAAGPWLSRLASRLTRTSTSIFQKQPERVRRVQIKVATGIGRFLRGLWTFMNPPLWAMLAAIVVASIPSLQRLFFTPGTFIQNSVTSAISQSGGVAVPLILVVLGANLARNTGTNDPHKIEDEKLNKKLLIAALISRMLLPILIMAPLIALAAKYVPISILDDPIFVVVCFLLIGAPSALQLAQICQINGVYENVMSKLLFQSYVIWILPSTLILVMCALEVVEWANAV